MAGREPLTAGRHLGDASRRLQELTKDITETDQILRQMELEARKFSTPSLTFDLHRLPSSRSTFEELDSGRIRSTFSETFAFQLFV